MLTSNPVYLLIFNKNNRNPEDKPSLNKLEAGSCSPLTLWVADAKVHHSSRQVPGAAAPTQVGVPSTVLRVQWSGQWRRELQVAEIRQGAPGT